MSQIWKKLKTACRIFLAEGLCVVAYKLSYKLHYGDNGNASEKKRYRKWIRLNEKNIYRTDTLSYKPLISVVVPVYNVDRKMLKQCIDSVCKQTYTNWELCLADDASTMPEVCQCLSEYEELPNVKIVYREKNGHISNCTNTAISLAEGEFVAFMDCDDVLAPNALYEVAKLLNRDRTLDFIYSDEDKLTEDGRKRHQPHFKPDWSPDTMMSLMYTSHLGVYRREIGEKIGWLREGYEGAQDYDFTLRFTEHTNHIGHIPKILYHWRERKESTAVNPEAKEYVKKAAKKAKEEALVRRGLKGEVEWVDDIYQYRVHYITPADTFVSVIIPSKDNFEVYKRCVDSLFDKTKGIEYEIITVDNGSNEQNRLKYETYAREKEIRYIYQKMEFNFSKMCNIGSKNARGNVLLLLNDDIEIIHEDWMEHMAGHACLPHVGAVGAKLLYPNSTLIQHIGVISFHNGPVHSFAQMDDTPIYYFCRNKIEYNYSAVTAACLMIEKKKYDEVGGLDESFAVAYNDVEFCFKLIEKGYYNVSRMDAILYHHESLSRGSDVMDEKKFERLKRERGRLYQFHPEFIGTDRFYSPNLTMQRADCSINNDLIEKKQVEYKEWSGRTEIERGAAKDNEVSFRLENILIDEREMYILGWYILKNKKFNNLFSTKIILIGSERSYIFNTTKVYREDMNQIAGCSGKNNLSSFCIKADISGLIEGKYKIFLLKNKKSYDTKQEVMVNHLT